MLMMTPWRQLAEGGGGITGSPFVRAFTAIGIPYAAGAMNLVVISAAISSANSNLYMTTRMLLSLARSGYAPRVAGGGRAATPACRCAPSPPRAPASALAILLAIFAPANAFLALYGTAVAGMLFIWIVILFTFLRFRRGAAAGPARAACRSGCPPIACAPGSASCRSSAIATTTFFVDGLQYSVVTFVPALPGLISIVYARRRGDVSMPDGGPFPDRRGAPAISGARRGPRRSSSSTTRPARRFRTTVLEAVTDHLSSRNVQRGGPYRHSREVDAMIARARDSVAAFVNARSADEIAFGLNATSFIRSISLASARRSARGRRSSSAISITRRTSRPGSRSSAPARASSGGRRVGDDGAGCIRRISSRC